MFFIFSSCDLEVLIARKALLDVSDASCNVLKQCKKLHTLDFSYNVCPSYTESSIGQFLYLQELPLRNLSLAQAKNKKIKNSTKKINKNTKMYSKQNWTPYHFLGTI